MDRITKLQALKANLVAKAKAITDALDEDEEREDLTAEERTEHSALIDRVEATNQDIETERRLQAADRAMPIDPNPPAGEISGGEPAAASDPKRGFAHMGEYAIAVLNASKPGPARVVDERLLIGADAPGTDYAQEAVGADGGFVVPPAFGTSVREYMLEEGSLLDLAQTDTVTGNGIDIPVSEQTPWGTTGIRMYWEGEAALANKDKPVVEMRQLRLRKLLGLVPATNEIIADASFMSTWLPRQLGISGRYKTNDAVVNGNGTGQPLGFANGGSIVEQAAEGSQTADTINSTNIARMYSRCINPINAEWLVNPDAFPQLVIMTIGDQPAYMPPSTTFANAPNGFLLGRPVRLSETCQTVGDAGDIYFANLRDGYQAITKQGGMQFATSMHLWFDYDMMAFRAVFRVDGQPVFRSAITPPNSAVTRSHFVRLAART